MDNGVIAGVVAAVIVVLALLGWTGGWSGVRHRHQRHQPGNNHRSKSTAARISAGL
jgi:hypothetical protein